MATPVALVMAPLLPWIRMGVGNMDRKYGGSRGEGGENRDTCHPLAAAKSRTITAKNCCC